MSKGFDVRGRALQAGELAAWLSEHSLGNRFGLTVMGTGVGHAANAVALAIVAADGDGRFIDTAMLTPDDEAALASWLADPGPPKAVHDAKSAMHALAGCGWALRGVTSDTVLAAYLLRPERRETTLNDLLVQHMRCALPDEVVAQQQNSLFVQSGGPDGRTTQALLLQTCAVLDLADVLDEELARIDSSSLLGRLELPVQRVLVDMETAGIAVEPARLGRNGGPDELLDSIGPDGRIHATFHQTADTTGRLSSSQSRLHERRDAVVAGDGFAGLLTARYVDLETQLLSHLGGRLDEARNAGTVTTLLGRRRHLPDLDSSNDKARAAAEHAAAAFTVQGSAADIVKAGMVSVDLATKALGLRSRLLWQADDELVFEVADGERDTLTAHVRDQLGEVYPLEVPLDISIGYGDTWDTATH